ncbi:UV excision repair protein rad23 [Coemansia aciculifera]|uniref:UV excision repair protein RAD23 n=1 Tax=Coemansia aciculifera TaxID=417176 RepID=A0A9W8IVW2_9FUNG|nr:UV excision repair protein rad23 [Coemansia aciculifera]KAJ2876854.1 UV excision repair protein rad23 [Coemansia aciculifera]
MQITLKTLQQKTFKIDVEPEDTIKDVKQKVEESQGYPKATQKLIFSGKILTDTQTVEELNISENDFMVVMAVKPKAAPKVTPKVEAATPVNNAPAAAQVAAPVAQRTAAAGLQAAEPATPSPPARNVARPSGASSGGEVSDQSLLLGEQYATAISNMVEMGYTREQCERAMRASFNNPDRAVEYLLNGIPEAALRMADQADARRTASQQQQSREDDADMQDSETAAVAAETGGAQPRPRPSGNLFHQAGQLTTPNSAAGQRRQHGLNNLAALRNTPQFRQLQQLVRENPPMLSQVLTQLAQQQPELMQLITNHEEEFFQMLMEGMSAEEMAAMAASSGMAGGDDESGEGALPAQYIRVTPEEKEAIERLQALGFPHELVVQAYFACDKNEELAANYLFDHGDDLMD